MDPASKNECRVVQDPRFNQSFLVGPHKYLQFDLGGTSFDVRAVERMDNETWRVRFN